MDTTTQPSKDKLVGDLKAIITDAEELLKLTAGQTGDKLGDVRGRMASTSPLPRSAFPKPRPH